MTTFTFPGYDYHVPAHRHINPDGSVGGWVANSATVAPTAFVGPDARVYDVARVEDSAHVTGNTRIYGTACVGGNAQVGGSALVGDSAQVYGNAKVGDTARVFGDAKVGGTAQIYGDARVAGTALVTRDTHITWGRAGGHSWTACANAGGSVTLQYGCEIHHLEGWDSLHESLSVEHTGDTKNAAVTRAVAAMAACLTLHTGDRQ